MFQNCRKGGATTRKKDDEHSKEEEEDEYDRLIEWERMTKEYEAKQKSSNKSESIKGGQKKVFTKKGCSDSMMVELEGGKVCREIYQPMTVMANIVMQEEIDGGEAFRSTEREEIYKSIVSTWVPNEEKISSILPLSIMTKTGELMVFSEEIVNSQEPPIEELSQPLGNDTVLSEGNLDNDKDNRDEYTN